MDKDVSSKILATLGLFKTTTNCLLSSKIPLHFTFASGPVYFYKIDPAMSAPSCPCPPLVWPDEVQSFVEQQVWAVSAVSLYLHQCISVSDYQTVSVNWNCQYQDQGITVLVWGILAESVAGNFLGRFLHSHSLREGFHFFVEKRGVVYFFVHFLRAKLCLWYVNY